MKVNAAALIPVEESEELVYKYPGDARREEEAVHVKHLLDVQLPGGALSQEAPK